MTAKTNIVVIGAGVSGLTTALLLAKDPKNSVTIVAKHMPGDYDIEYASPWAGANYSPFAPAGSQTAEWEKETWQPLAHLAQNVPESGIHFQKSRAYSRNKDNGTLLGSHFGHFTSESAWFKDILPDFRVLSPAELPRGADTGTEFTSVCINTALYLPYLVGQCRAAGVVLARGVLAHVADAAWMHHSKGVVDVVVNCSGLMASALGGVEDKNVVPARGQTVLVRNEAPYMAVVSGTDDAGDELGYCMTRASGGGTVLGGCYQLGNWEAGVDKGMAERILKRAVEFCPGLVEKGRGVEGLSVVRHAVGLRPTRTGGIRLEKETIGDPGVWVVHNYGHGGYGYQVSYACSRAVVKLVNEIVGIKARL